MKYLKYFENIKDDPQVDDYVLINIDISTSILDKKHEIMKFVNNTIGQISKIREDSVDYWGHKDKGDVMVVYDNVPKEIKSWFTFRRYDNEQNPKYNGLYCRTFDTDKIVAFNKDKDKLEQIITNNKFNI